MDIANLNKTMKTKRKEDSIRPAQTELMETGVINPSLACFLIFPHNQFPCEPSSVQAVRRWVDRKARSTRKASPFRSLASGTYTSKYKQVYKKNPPICRGMTAVMIEEIKADRQFMSKHSEVEITTESHEENLRVETLQLHVS